MRTLYSEVLLLSTCFTIGTEKKYFMIIKMLHYDFDTFVNRLEMLYDKRDTNMSATSLKAGLGVDFIRSLKNVKGSPKLDNFLKLCNALDTNPLYALALTDNDTPFSEDDIAIINLLGGLPVSVKKKLLHVLEWEKKSLRIEQQAEKLELVAV